MKELLIKISQLAIRRADPNIIIKEEQKQTGWLGNAPATIEEIDELETRLNVRFPEDYKEFLNLCNGFSAPNHIEPSFLPAQEVTWLKDVDPSLVEIWNTEELRDIGQQLERSIIIAGIEEEQYLLLIPPFEHVGWSYWKFANWHPGEHAYGGLEEYFKDVLTFMEDLENKEN
ncbi:SMI1/KNR4 family protein [Desertivirga arenae]|uniref:SMI1/KNR4 family protein n=1 Tax=Desertivirga arenae TaxID=2810309 RepID=UPI001A967E4A|nr:SMI1/KNR4 family protein [Pedobacter sp. SYSU D00823]